MEFVDEKLHQLVASDGSRANATIITASLGDGNYNLSSLDDGMRTSEIKATLSIVAVTSRNHLLLM